MGTGALGRARAVVAVVGLTILFGAPSAAAQLTITPVTVGDFSTVTLNGAGQLRTASIDPFSVTDGRLIATGWHVTVAATTFQRWDGFSYGAGNPFPAGSLRMEQVTAAPADPLGTPPNVTPGPYAIDGASVRIATAAPVLGLGTFTFTHGGPLRLIAPASAYAGTYRAEVTVSVASGP